MFWLIKQVFIGLLSFHGSLATKCMSLNNEQCKTRLTFVDLNPVELKYCLSMISLDECSGNCNSVDDLSTKICVPNQTKSVINVKVFNMIARTYEAKTLIKHISCDCKCKFNSRTCNLNQKCNNDKSLC